jgi:leader peptidase (prepilin peptidase)/N-methyltransferase
LPACAALFGLVLGSFLNVVIYRLPLGESIVSPRSRCPGCKRLVASYDNVPVLSFLVLRGRCRHCDARISVRYPAIELAVGGAALASFLRHGPSLELAVEFAFVAAMIALVFIDYDHQILPDPITLTGLAVGLALAGPRETITVVDALKGAALGGGLLFAVSEVYFRIKKVEGMGFGDVKMMAMIGAFVGWKGVLLTLFLGSFVGSIVGLIVIVMSGGDMKTKLPFGTFLGMGAIATIYAGPPVLDWYTGLF